MNAAAITAIISGCVSVLALCAAVLIVATRPTYRDVERSQLKAIASGWRAEVAARHLLQSLEELNSTCHCGRPAEVNEILGYSRGMCADCDAWRCDAYPAGCHHLNPIEQAHVDKRRKGNGS